MLQIMIENPLKIPPVRPQQISVDVKNNQILSISIQKDGNQQPIALNAFFNAFSPIMSCALTPIGAWPMYENNLAFKVQADGGSVNNQAVKRVRPVVLGKIFRLLPGGKAEPTKSGNNLRPGMIAWINFFIDT